MFKRSQVSKSDLVQKMREHFLQGVVAPSPQHEKKIQVQ